MIRTFAATGGLLALLATTHAVAAAAPPACKLDRAVELKVEVSGLRAHLPAKVNGQQTEFVVDSGAFYSTVDQVDAQRLGLKKLRAAGGTVITEGVGGEVENWIGSAETFEIGGVTFKGLTFLVVGQDIDQRGAGLIGQNVLGVMDAEYDLANGFVRLFNPINCGDQMLAYWSQEGAGQIKIDEMAAVQHGVGQGHVAAKSERSLGTHITGFAKINGKSVRVLFDTGAGYSYLTLDAAKKLGFRADGEGVVSAGKIGGLGKKSSESWIAPFANFTLGDEQINNTKLRVADFDLEDADMLLGADFFLSHRIYVSRSQHKLYFTYNGGPVFRLERAPATPAKPAAAAKSD